MKIDRRLKALTLYPLLILVCGLFTAFTFVITAPHFKEQNAGYWIITFEAFMPSLIIALALILQLVRKAQ